MQSRLALFVASCSLVGAIHGSAHADTGMLVDFGGRAFLGNRKVPRDGNFSAAFHLAATVVQFSRGDSAFSVGARYDKFLLTRAGADSRIVRGTVGYGSVREGLNLREFYVGYRHVNDALAGTGLGRAHGPTFGYHQQYGTVNFHVFWEVAAITYVRNDMGGSVGAEGRLRVAYILGTLEWYMRVDPATGGEFGIGLGGATGFEL